MFTYTSLKKAKHNFKSSHSKSSKSKSFVDSISFLHKTIGNQAVSYLIQKKLKIGKPDDIYEKEADQVAEKIMTVPASTGTSCEEKEKKIIQTKKLAHNGAETDLDLKIIIPRKSDSGNPLPLAIRYFMEEKFGHDFGSVRVHTDNESARITKALNAEAFTYGKDIYFAEGRYKPATEEGKKLLAHELTHVAQQKLRGKSFIQFYGGFFDESDFQDPMDDPRMHTPGAPHAVNCSIPSHCPPGFCKPYTSESYARHQLMEMMPLLLIGIGLAVDSRVVSLWRDHLLGGSSPRDLSSQFANDFTNSKTTYSTTLFLLDAMRANLQANPPTSTPVSLDFSTRLNAQLMEIDDPNSANQMNFNIPKEVPGNIAGGIGKDQTTCPAGAKPSPFNDERRARVSAYIEQTANGDMLVTPFITFFVRDTIDLCPGDCGTWLEQFATVPISQFEATGISGDVPFTVEFPAPASLLRPFIITTGGVHKANR